MEWLVPYNKLDDQQKEFIDSVDINKKNYWIKGFPGSGKSVLLAYTLQKIKDSSSNAKVAIVVFTHSLIKMFKDAINSGLPEKKTGIYNDVDIITYYDFMRSQQKYDYVLTDEVQDLVPSVLAEMNSRSSHVIVAGDENQSIYEKDPKYGENTVLTPQIPTLISANVFELDMLHRLTHSIINIVQRFLPKLNIFAKKRDMTKKSTQVRICEATTETEEVEYIMAETQKRIDIGESVAILIPNHKDIISFVNIALTITGKEQWKPVTNNWGRPNFGDLNTFLEKEDMPLQYVGNGYGDFSARSIIVMTYHSSKGLDFDNVFMPRLNNRLYISPNEDLNKRLFMVAMTRSKNNLFLTYSGIMNKYLLNFESECSRINIHDTLQGRITNNSSENDDIFGGI